MLRPQVISQPDIYESCSSSSGEGFPHMKKELNQPHDENIFGQQDCQKVGENSNDNTIALKVQETRSTENLSTITHHQRAVTQMGGKRNVLKTLLDDSKSEFPNLTEAQSLSALRQSDGQPTNTQIETVITSQPQSSQWKMRGSTMASEKQAKRFRKVKKGDQHVSDLTIQLSRNELPYGDNIKNQVKKSQSMETMFGQDENRCFVNTMTEKIAKTRMPLNHYKSMNANMRMKQLQNQYKSQRMRQTKFTKEDARNFNQAHSAEQLKSDMSIQEFPGFVGNIQIVDQVKPNRWVPHGRVKSSGLKQKLDHKQVCSVEDTLSNKSESKTLQPISSGMSEMIRQQKITEEEDLQNPEKINSQTANVFPFNNHNILKRRDNVLLTEEQYTRRLERSVNQKDVFIPSDNGKDKILNRTINFRSKVDGVHKVFAEQIHRADKEYVQLAGLRDSKEGQQRTIKQYMKEHKPIRTYQDNAPVSDFELKLRKQNAQSNSSNNGIFFTDHQNQYISATGHKIDDYNVKLSMNENENALNNKRNCAKLLQKNLMSRILTKTGNLKENQWRRVNSELLWKDEKRMSCQNSVNSIKDIQEKYTFRSQAALKRKQDEDKVQARKNQLRAYAARMEKKRADMRQVVHSLPKKPIRRENPMSKSIPAFKKHLAFDSESEISDRTFDSTRQDVNEQNIQHQARSKKRHLHNISLEFRRGVKHNDIGSTFVLREHGQANMMQKKRDQLLENRQGWRQLPLKDLWKEKELALVEDEEPNEEKVGFSQKKYLDEKRKRGRKYWDNRKEDLGSSDEEKQKAFERSQVSQRDKLLKKEQMKKDDMKPGVKSAEVAFLDGIFNVGHRLPPFCFKSCLVTDPTHMGGQIVLRLTNVKLNEDIAQSISNAVKIYDKDIHSLEIGNVGLNDRGISLILNSCMDTFASDFTFDTCHIGKMAQQSLLTITKQRDDPLVMRPIFLTGLNFHSCKFEASDKEGAAIIKSLFSKKTLPLMDEQTIRTCTPLGKTVVELNSPVKAERQTDGKLGNTIQPIEDLSLRYCKLSSADFLIPLVRDSPSLKRLDLSYSSLKMGGLDKLSLVFCQSPTLKFLDLTGSCLSKFAVYALRQTLKYSMSLLDLNLSFMRFEDPAACVVELFKGLTESQTLQSLHLNGMGNSIDPEVLHELEKQILGLKSEKQKYFNDVSSQQTSSLQEDISLYGEENQQSPIQICTKNFDGSHFNSDLYSVRSVPQKSKYLMPPSNSKEDQLDKYIMQLRQTKNINPALIEQLSPPGQISEESRHQKRADFFKAEDEQFSVMNAFKLVYSRQLASKFFGQAKVKSDRWARQQDCWICENWNMVVLLCEITCKNIAPDTPDIKIGQAPNQLMKDSDHMIPIDLIVPELMFEEISSDISENVSVSSNTNSQNEQEKVPLEEKHSTRHDLKTIKTAFEQHGLQYGFKSTVMVIPTQRSSKFKMQKPGKIVHTYSRIYAYSFMMRPGMRQQVRINGRYTNDIAIDKRTKEVMTIFKDFSTFALMAELPEQTPTDYALEKNKQYLSKVGIGSPLKSHLKLTDIEKKLEKIQQKQLNDIGRLSHFNQMKPVFQDAVNKEGPFWKGSYHYHFLQDVNGFADSVKRNFEECFDGDFFTANISRIVLLGKQKKRNTDQHIYEDQESYYQQMERNQLASKIKVILRAAFPSIVELFRQELSLSPYPFNSAYYPMIKQEQFQSLVRRMQLLPGELSEHARTKKVAEMCQVTSQYLKEVEANQTRKKFAKALNKLGKTAIKKAEELRQEEEKKEKEEAERRAREEQGCCGDDAADYENEEVVQEYKRYEEPSPNTRDLSQLYFEKPEGIRRCQMLELVIRLALAYFPNCPCDVALEAYCSQVLPRLPWTNVSARPYLPQQLLKGMHGYRAMHIITPEVDTVFIKHRLTVKKLIQRMKIKGIFFQFNAVMLIFGKLYPKFKAEIHSAFVLSKNQVSEEKEGRERHFTLTKQELYEFLVTLSRYVVCGGQKRSFVKYGGESNFAGKPSYTRGDYNVAQIDEKFFGYKRVSTIAPLKKTEKPFSDDYSELEEGYLPYFITLDILFKQIEDKLQYI